MAAHSYMCGCRTWNQFQGAPLYFAAEEGHRLVLVALFGSQRGRRRPQQGPFRLLCFFFARDHQDILAKEVWVESV